MIKIDGMSFDVPIIKMQRQVDVLDKYAERTEDGILHREIIGVYFNYTINFGFPINKKNEYHRLFEKLTEAVEFHNVTLFDETGEYTFIAYISSVKDEIIRVYAENDLIICDGLTCKFTAKIPAKSKGG